MTPETQPMATAEFGWLRYSAERPVRLTEQDSHERVCLCLCLVLGILMIGSLRFANAGRADRPALRRSRLYGRSIEVSVYDVVERLQHMRGCSPRAEYASRQMVFVN